MKNLKTTILSACIALCCLTNGNAQEAARGKSRGKIAVPGRPGTIAVFGGGTSMPSSDGKDKAFLSNSTAINADAFFSLISKPEGNFSFGLNFGGAYNFGGSGGFGTTPNPFVVTGQTSSIVSDRGGDPAQAGFRMGAGPQANFYFGKFIVSPMVLGEYFSMTQKERSRVQTTQFNGQSYDFNLATLPETKTSGFAVTPKLRLHYMFNDRFGLFADASYTMGPKIETTVSKLIPNGNPSPQSGSYNIQQLQTGTVVKGETKSTAYSAMGFNFGVVIGLGKNGNKGWNGVAETAQSTDASKTSASCSCKSVNMYSTEYPSTGAYTTTFATPIPNNMPSSELSIPGKKLHLYFPNAPFNPSSGSACNGQYKATVNGTTYTSYGPPSGQDNHIEIPVNALVVGINTIAIIGTDGTTNCILNSKVVNVTLPATPTAITLTPECCVVSKKVGSVTTTSFDGSVKYKIIGIPNGCSLKIVNGTATSYAPIVNGSYTNCYFGNVQITVVDATTLLPVTGSTINGLSLYNYTPRRFQCVNISKLEVAIDRDILLVPQGPFRQIDGVGTEVITWSLEDFNGFRLNGSGTGKDGGKIDMSCPVGIDEETGKIYLTGTPEITKTVNGKTSKIKSDYKPTQKRDYVGHVTLLR